MELDIRNSVGGEIDTIRICDAFETKNLVEILARHKVKMRAGLYDSAYPEDAIYIADREHAENTIKAIQKAIDLGWFK